MLEDPLCIKSSYHIHKLDTAVANTVWPDKCICVPTTAHAVLDCSLSQALRQTG